MFKAYNRAELQFDLVHEIGHAGKNSRTFTARDHQLNADIVMKRLEKARMNDPAEFFAESAALYASSHPHVVQVHYACEDADFVYLAMPYYRQGSVKGLMAAGFLTVREVITLGAQTLSALHNIHSKGLIHFDVKPDNILLSDRREALLSDFGLARQVRGGLAGQDRLYLKMVPPEAFARDHFDRTFDIFQLGLTLYRMCNGDEVFYQQFDRFGAGAAFDRHTFRHAVANGHFPDRSRYPAHVPLKLRNVIRQCLATDPNDRYQSALEVSNELADISGRHLDWRLAPHPDRRVWTKNIEGTEFEFEVTCAGVSTLRRRSPGGAFRRIGDGCRAGVSETDVKRILGAY
ncbi:serine/threonine-protein kinase [Sphingomonas sp. LY54]|uniref:serine/threonine-protein kinase n=1 Tax=Sphingomonas sp. LY54 TaxID=3095343 RepID=UPI002D77C37C|nr:serine/threonine-protein kinase [Sphingomonas sp. LY54]WRP27184.1 serine/threonine-protein kinase [Sphingomonas sp. LY54]